MKEESAAFVSQLSRQNITKEWWTHYYVSNLEGDDGANGLTRSSKLKTVQAAINKGESGVVIHVEDGTYPETLILNKEHIKIEGQSRSGTIIAPATAVDVVDMTHAQCELHNLKIVFPTGVGATSALELGSFKNIIDNVWLHNAGNGGWGFLLSAGHDEQTITNCKVTGFLNQLNIAGGDKHVIHDNDLTLNGAGGVNIDIDSANRCLIFNNYCDGGGAGTGINSSGNTKNAYFHNNILNHAANQNALEDSANNTWRENYYDDGPADIDNDGYGDSPYDVGNPAGTDYDYFPIAKVNGWGALKGKGVTGGEYQGDIEIWDSFEYPSDTALQAKWIEGGGAPNPVRSLTAYYGKYSMELSAAGIGGSVYRLIASRNMKTLANISIAAYTNNAGDTFDFTLYDSLGNYSYWTQTMAAALTWYNFNINPHSAPTASSVIPVDLEDVVKIGIYDIAVGSTYFIDFIRFSSIVSSIIGIGYDGLDDAVEDDSSVRGHLLLTGDTIGAGYDAANDNPREDGSARGHLLFNHEHVEAHEIDDYSEYGDTTVNCIKADKEYPILEVLETGGSIYVYKYVWTVAQAGVDPTETLARTEITHFDGDMFELSKIFININMLATGLYTKMGAADKAYIYAEYNDGGWNLLPDVQLLDKAIHTPSSALPVDTDVGDAYVIGTDKVQLPRKFIVYLRNDGNIATYVAIPFMLGVRRAH